MFKKKLKIKNFEKRKIIRLRLCLGMFALLFFLLLFRIAWLQFVGSGELKEKASKQQLLNKILSPQRGSIYDATGKTLAISVRVDTVSIDPTKVKYSNGENVEYENLSQSFSKIFDLDYDEILEKMKKTTSTYIIAEKVENDKIEILNKWLNENKIISGINITEDIKRYYTYSNLASNLIGFTGKDGHGLVGLEYSLNSKLSGTVGKITAIKDAISSEIPNNQENYIAPQNGNDIFLTIDLTVQSIAEKYLSQAVTDNNADGGNVIIMNPSNGNILAMATYPNYNLNTPFVSNIQENINTWENLSQTEKSSFLYKMWKNTAVENTYEPGSTFKLITTATALEENLVTTDNKNDFYCSGSEKVSNINISCWRSSDPHGYQSLRDALANSCNPAFIQLGRKIGADTLYKYYKAFGLFDKTNSNFYGETNSIFYDLSKVGEIELATLSFGQRFTITPLQLITAASCIANEGVLVKPKIIKEIKNADTGAITIEETKEVRQVISKETAETMMDLLENVVTNGTGKYAKVIGYSVGGKSGTSEPIVGSENEGYVASFIGFSPTVNTEVVVLVTIYNPKAGSYQGGQVAGPVVSQILREILPYLGVVSENSTSSQTNVSKSAFVPDVRGKTIQEAKNILKIADFSSELIENENENITIITDQVPKPGTNIISNSTVFLYTSLNNNKVFTTVPNLKDMSSAQAINSISASNLNLIINGSGIVITQDIASGSSVEKGTVITVTLQSKLSGGY